MKTSCLGIILAIIALPLLLLGCRKDHTASNTLVILHTNDTHSQIDPDSHDRGGVVRRLAVIDSIRRANPNTMLVDAGDVVQGTLYYYFYGGKVEQEVLNIMGLDLGILGNHEFDNGIDSLASILKLRNSPILSTNYETDGTPLSGMLESSYIRQIGDKKVAFMGLNLDPEGIISPENYGELGYDDAIEEANEMAAHLKNVMDADVVIALSHIGYNPAGLPGDSLLAVSSHDIDIIIGGHSHDTIDPGTAEGERRSRMTNADGREVLVVQTGKAGRNLGMITLNLDSIGLGARPRYSLIPIDGRHDALPANPDLESLIAKYRHGVDSMMTDWIGTATRPLPADGNELLNFFADYVYSRGASLMPDVDLAIVNKGGLRTDIPQGRFSKGQIINLLPFRNRIVVVDVEGDDLQAIFEVMASTEGNGVSDNVRATYIPGGEHPTLGSVTINGNTIDPEKTYRVATIDYLASGGDYMSGFRDGEVVAHSDKILYDDLIEYFTTGAGTARPLESTTEPRWTPATR